MTVHITYEDYSYEPPYIFDGNPKIIFTGNCELYAAPYDDDAIATWEILNGYTGYVINIILDEIKPYVEKLCEHVDENGEIDWDNDDVANDIYDKIEKHIVYWNEHSYSEENGPVITYWEEGPIDYYETYFGDVPSPEAVGYFVENSLEYGVMFGESPEEAIDEAYDYHINIIREEFDDDKLYVIENIHKKYIDDHLEDLFYKNFIPRLLKEIPELTYDGKNFFYDDEPLE